MPRRFCAICGKELDSNSPHFGMCLECYLKENPLFELPDKFKFKICPDCGRFTKRKKWLKPKKQGILKIIKEAIREFLIKSYKEKNINFEIGLDEDSIVLTSKNLIKKIEVIIYGYIKNNPKLNHQQRINLIINYDLCKNCSRIRGGNYFVSIIQLRVKNESYYDKINEVIQIIQPFVENQFEKDRRQYITKLIEQKRGADLYISTKKLTNQILNILDRKYHFIKKRSRKLVGRNTQEGKNVYRHKFLIKFLPVEREDRIKIYDEIFEINNILKNTVIMKNNKNEKKTKDYGFFFENKFQKINND
ncbi:MAG: NMD3-related protein [Promethearchaeia archaeon]